VTLKTFLKTGLIRKKMKNLSKAHSILLLISFIATLSLLGCGGCASQNTIPSAQSVKTVEWNLSVQAQNTYAYLLYDQALRKEDEDLVLVALRKFKSSNMPISMYIESGVWLMSRRSPNTLPALKLGLEKYPRDISLVLLYAESLQDDNQSAQAIDFMRQYIKDNKDSIDAKLEISLLLIKIHKYQEAQNELADIPEKQRTPLINYYMARAFIGLEQTDKAIPFLKKAIKGSPAFIEALAELAYIYEKNLKLKEASALYEKMLKLNDGSQEVLLRIISLYLKQNNVKKALEFVEKGPDSNEFAMLVATMFIEAKNLTEAEKILLALTKHDDYPPEANFYLAAIAYEKNKNIGNALKWLEKIPKDSDYHKRAVILQIQMLAGENRIGEALAKTQNAKLDYPERFDLWQIEIQLLAKLNKLAEALDIATLAIIKWPENAELIFLQASLFDELGDKENALRVMELLLNINPDHHQALNYVGYTLAEKAKDLPRAISLLKRAISLSPHSSYIMDSLAWAQFKAGQLKDAWENINKAVSLKGGADPTVWEHYGDIATALGNTAEAKKAYTEALRYIPADFNGVRKRLENKIK